jgi:hypothetical protein
MPIAFAIERTDQCVAFGGVSVTALVKTVALRSSANGLRPGGRDLSRVTPSKPSSAKGCCRRQIVVLSLPVSFAVAPVLKPRAVARTICAR